MDMQEKPTQIQSENVPYYSWMSLLITLCPLIPLPFIDFFLEPILAKRMFSSSLPQKEIRSLFASKNDSFCLGCIWGIFSGLFFWILKPLRIIRMIFTFQAFIDTFQYWLYKAYIVERVVETFDEERITNTEWMHQFSIALDLELRKKQLGTTMRMNIQKMFVDNGVVKTLQSWWKDLRSFRSSATGVTIHQDRIDSQKDDSQKDDSQNDNSHMETGTEYNLSPISFIRTSISKDEQMIVAFLQELKQQQI